MEQYATALAVGKFYPPHAGHHALIDAAVEECGRVYVGVCYSKVESIPVEDRIAWLKDRHPTVCFFPVYDDSPVNYTDETWGLFLDALVDGLHTVWANHGLSSMYRLPTVIYSGEDYAPEFATRLRQHIHENVNLIGGSPEIKVRMMDRKALPLSATKFRNDPVAYWDVLSPATRAGMCKRIVVCGAESSGTTTLAKALAESFKTTVVPEYGRHYDWAVGPYHEWDSDDFMHIALEQKRWEDNLARRSQNGLLICDTDEYATAMFKEVYLESLGPEIIALAAESPADLYLVTDHEGVEFEDDGQRISANKRAWMTGWLLRKLPGNNVHLVTGDHNHRLGQAMGHISGVWNWKIDPPIEQRSDYEHNGISQQ